MNHKLTLFPLALIAFAVITLLLFQSSLGLGDWPAFHNASQALLRGEHPYLAHVPDGGRTLCIYNPPWVLALTAPFALLPIRLGWAMLNATCLLLVLLTARRLGASWLVLLLSIPILYRATWTGNVDGFTFFGAALPAPAGLFLAILKPQNTLGLILFWAFWAWRQGGLPRLIRTFLPVGIALAVSLALFGPWYRVVCPFTTSAHFALFPAGVPFGLLMLGLAIATKRKYLALAASPLLSPYFSYSAIILLPVWGLMFLQDFAAWLYRAGAQALVMVRQRPARRAFAPPDAR
ncbi:MAG TPA: hypothetical protein VFF68_08895 [Anaerolineaceae bacterium]|nr:hypothetical protein [Anaerolineaceae bacterium]